MKRRFLLTTHFDFIALRRFEDRQFAEVVTLVAGLLTVGNSTMVSINSSSNCGIALPWIADPRQSRSSVFSSPPVHCWCDFHRRHKSTIRRATTSTEQTIWQPALARALVATASLPGALTSSAPAFSDARRNAARQPHTGTRFLGTAKRFIFQRGDTPALFPGDGFS